MASYLAEFLSFKEYISPKKTATFQLARQPTNPLFSPKTLVTEVSKLNHVCRALSAKVHPIQAAILRFIAQKADFRDCFCLSGPRGPVTFLLPTQLLTCQNLQPVTYQARKPHYLAEFQNCLLTVKALPCRTRKRKKLINRIGNCNWKKGPGPGL